MADLYVHGVVIKEGGSEVRQIRSPNQSVIGMVGTAPSSTVLKDNVPSVFLKKKSAIEAVYPADAKGDKGTLYDAVVGVYDQLEATVVLIKSASVSEADLIKAVEILADAESLVGHKPKIILAPGFGNTNPPAPTPTPTPDPDSDDPPLESNRNNPVLNKRR
ncbi:MAG: hypothetical protein M3Q07_11835 [Pseudobdellovibrionaceae bacterium]|nr:hypothetical protein [Pseudobdellovibrionaceae bacterium]